MYRESQKNRRLGKGERVESEDLVASPYFKFFQAPSKSQTPNKDLIDPNL